MPRPAELAPPATLRSLDPTIASGCDVLFQQYASLVTDARSAAAAASPSSGRPARRRKLDPAADGGASVLRELGMDDLIGGGAAGGGAEAARVAAGEGWRALRALRRAATPTVGLRRYQYGHLLALARSHALHADPALSPHALAALADLTTLHPPTSAAPPGPEGAADAAVTVDGAAATPADGGLTADPLDQADDTTSFLTTAAATPGGGAAPAPGARHSAWGGLCALAAAARAVACAAAPPPPSTVADAALFAHFARQLADDGAVRVRAARAPGVPRGRAATLLRHSLVARLFWDGALGGAVEGRKGPAPAFVSACVGAVARCDGGGGGGGGGGPSTQPPPPSPPAAFFDATAAADAAATALRALAHVASAAEAAGAFHVPRPPPGAGAAGGNARAALDAALAAALFASSALPPAARAAVLSALHPRDARRLVTLEAARRCGHRAGGWRAELDAAAAHAAAPWLAPAYYDGCVAAALEAVAAETASGGAGGGGGALALGGGDWRGVAAVVAAAAVAGAAVVRAGYDDFDPRGPLPDGDADAADGGARLAKANDAAVTAVAARLQGDDPFLELARCVRGQLGV